MLDDLNMDKKPQSRSLGPSKPGTSETKKNTDVQNGKQFPRSSRKREPSTGGVIVKNDQRKPPPQKGKIWDKRPRPRGLYYGNKKENSKMSEEECEAEFSSLFGGNKQQNLNHLLNFHYEPRGSTAAGTFQRKAIANQNIRSLMSTHAHKYNKEQFLQANCQFVVRFDGNYASYMGDPDLLVDWNYVELIRVGSTEEVSCPICLYWPNAAKITRCGHIYCWTCILHYLALSDKTWRKCPICYEAIHHNDLKSVETIKKTVLNIGQEITLKLMKRVKGSLITAPVQQYGARSSKLILDFGEKKISTVYSKLLRAQREDIENLIKREHHELQEKVIEFKGCPEICFVEEALQSLGLRKQCLQTDVKPLQSKHEIIILSNDHTSQETENTASLTLDFNSDEPLGSPKEMSLNDLGIEHQTVSPPLKNFYFYQAEDGQHIYLHPINVKMLEMTYGRLEDCPETIVGIIVEKEPGSMTSELRKRLKYLEHVPITCQFEVVELDLTVPLVSPEAITTFHDQIEIRRKRRIQHARAEKRREMKIEENERRQYGRGPVPNLRIESHYHFPECGETIELPRHDGSNRYDVSTNSHASSRSQSPLQPLDGFCPTDIDFSSLSICSPPEDNSMSFAQMLREGKTIKANSDAAWPTVGEIGESAACNGYWVQTRRQRQESVTASHESDCEHHYALSPPAKSSFNIAEALEAASRIENGKEVAPGRKKKKKHHKILFATGLQCPGTPNL